jgi:FkbM family methyltransferase
LYAWGYELSQSWINPVIEYYKIFFGDKADIIIDVGTRDGDDAFQIATALDSKEIYAIEARQEAAQEAMTKYPSFDVSNIAISNFSGVTDFYSIISDDKDYAGSSSFYNNKFTRQEYPHKIIQVNTVTMDQFIEGKGLEGRFLDVVKVDIEGYTWELLDGFTKHMNNVKLFHLETEKVSTHSNHRNSEEIKDFMFSKNFILAGTQYEWDKEIEDQVWINKYLINNERERQKWLIS